MPYRILTDSTGTEWQVWDIVPRLSERRSGEHTDRRVQIAVIPFADRRHEARRTTEMRRAILRGTYAQGWLCFESHKEKRRLTPIPDDWTTCSDELLEAYAHRAERVSGGFRMITDFNSEEPLAEAG
jgi:hypothetical protein